MRAEKSGPTSEHPQPALVVRASLPRTFLGLGLCLEAGLLACGGYLVEQALREPLHADQTAVLAGGAFLVSPESCCFTWCALSAETSWRARTTSNLSARPLHRRPHSRRTYRWSGPKYFSLRILW